MIRYLFALFALFAFAFWIALGAGSVAAAPPGPLVDPLRGEVAVNAPTTPPRLRNAVNDDLLQARNYDKQPPIIPHRVDGYQVDKNFNKCLDCHARGKVEFSRAIPVSPTHYLDRNGKVLAQVSTRRYFCMQCHVAQDPVSPLVGNSFRDIDSVVRDAAAALAAPGK